MAIYTVYLLPTYLPPTYLLPTYLLPTYLLPTYFLPTLTKVRARVTRWREQHAAVPMDASRLALLELGLASHHAGMLPWTATPLEEDP